MRWVMVITLLIVSSDVFSQFSHLMQRYENYELNLLVKEGQVVENLLTKERHYVLFVGDIEDITFGIEQRNKETESLYLKEDLGDVYSSRVFPKYNLDITFYGDTYNVVYMGIKGETEWVDTDSVYQNEIELIYVSTICYEFINVSVDVCNE